MRQLKIKKTSVLFLRSFSGGDAGPSAGRWAVELRNAPGFHSYSLKARLAGHMGRAVELAVVLVLGGMSRSKRTNHSFFAVQSLHPLNQPKSTTDHIKPDQTKQPKSRRSLLKTPGHAEEI